MKNSEIYEELILLVAISELEDSHKLKAIELLVDKLGAARYAEQRKG